MTQLIRLILLDGESHLEGEGGIIIQSGGIWDIRNLLPCLLPSLVPCLSFDLRSWGLRLCLMDLSFC
uniref:Uncharacterized protein n=1 Tax=Steinernema glaseri TaxID=37863 RepID=A0A1I7ZL73_9BILA